LETQHAKNRSRRARSGLLKDMGVMLPLPVAARQTFQRRSEAAVSLITAP
jgi:hypothetical protein